MALVIVNPASGGGRAARAWRRVGADWCRLHGWASAETRGPGDARRIARERAADTDLIVAFGGDGTLSEVAAGILDVAGRAALAIVPCGTGNDFARTIGVARDPAAGLAVAASGATRRLDAGEVLFADDDGREARGWFVNSASFGLSGDVADTMQRLDPRLGGTLRFALATLRAAWAARPCRVSVTSSPGEARLSDEWMQVSLTNGRYFGAGMKVAPHADPADGWLDLVLVKPIAFGRLPFELPRLYAGTHLTSRFVSAARVQALSATVEGPRRVRLELDGEIVGWLPARITVRPAAIRVQVPASAPSR